MSDEAADIAHNHFLDGVDRLWQEYAQAAEWGTLADYRSAKLGSACCLMYWTVLFALECELVTREHFLSNCANEWDERKAQFEKLDAEYSKVVKFRLRAQQ